MQKTFVQVLGFSALLLACKAAPEPARMGASARADAAVVVQRDADVESERDAGAADSGAKSDRDEVSSEASDCDAMRCERQGAELAASLMAADPIAPTIKGGDCARVDIDGLVAGMACTCISSNGWLYIGPKGAGCFARGRAGDCLWDDSEFVPCTAGDPKCSAMCQELQQRYAADSARTFHVEVRSSTCRNGSCRHVLHIEDACYTDRSIKSGQRFECSLSDTQILDREDQAR